MKMRVIYNVLGMIMLVSLGASPVLAGDSELADIEHRLARIAPGGKPDAITRSPVQGLYEISYGTKIFYLSRDGRFLLQGDLLDLAHKTNLTEVKRARGRLSLLKSVDADTMIVFAPKQPRHLVSVFTDIDCPYCRKLHRHIGEYNRLGIGFRYMAYPRSGVNTPSYFKAVSVWCATDRKLAMTKAKTGEKIASKTCDNPVRKHMALADRLGVTGTPTMLLDDGTVIPGYVPPKQLARILDGQKAGN